MIFQGPQYHYENVLNFFIRRILLNGVFSYFQASSMVFCRSFGNGNLITVIGNVRTDYEACFFLNVSIKHLP